MPWIKLDDSFLTNAKILQAGLEARALYVAGLCYCGKTLSDGAIPAGMVPKLAALADVDDAASAAATLVALGLWHDAPGGFAVHDYLDYNPTRQQAESNAAQRALSGSIGGKRSGEARRERANPAWAARRRCWNANTTARPRWITRAHRGAHGAFRTSRSTPGCSCASPVWRWSSW